MNATAAEAAEWQAIHDKHRAEIARRGGIRPPRAVPLAELEQHAVHAEALSAAGVAFGPDTSEYQGQPAWGTVKASGCALGFYKVSEGRTYQDPSHQWSKARVPGTGLVPAGYHFLYFSAEYVDKPGLWGAQAEFFASLVDPAAGHLLDVEAAATAGHHLGVTEWVAEYRRLFPSHPLGCYSNLALWTNRSRMPYDPRDLFDYLWHAGVGDGFYTAATGTIPQQWAGTSKLTNSFAAHGFPACRLWQITDHAQVPGVGGSFCDGNAFQGSPAELKALITTGDADMPLTDAEWTKLGTIVDQKIKANFDDIASAVVGAKLGSSGPTVGVALQSGYNFAKTAASNTDTLEAATQAIQTAVTDPTARGALIDAISASTANKLAAGVHVDPTDPEQLKSVLGEALDEHLALLRITNAPPAAAQ